MTDSTNSTHDDQRHGEVSLARKVSRMGMLIHRYYEAQAHQNGATGDPLRGQGRVLALLKAKPETTQRELSYLLDMRQQSLSELLLKLEEKGFVTREKSADDGRVTVVRLTEAGAEAAPSPEQMQQRADALDCLTEEEQTQLDGLTEKVTTSLEHKLEEMGVDTHQGPRGPHHGHGPSGSDRRGPRGQHDQRRPYDRDDRGGRGDRGPRGDRGGRGDRDDRGDRNQQRTYGNDGSRGQRDQRRTYGNDGSRGNRDQRDQREQREQKRNHDYDGLRRGPYRPREDRDNGRTWQA